MFKRNSKGQFVKGMTFKHSKKTKKKISKIHKGIPKSKKHKQKLSDVWDYEKHFTKETRKKLRMWKRDTEEKSSGWKGDKAGYSAMHRWIERQKGKAKEHKCLHCNRQAKDWANVDHTYKRILDDYIPLCQSCHMKYDTKYNNVKFGRNNKLK